jgi:Flp pilus assembly protein TadD
VANELFESARYQEALDAYNLAIQSSDTALVTRARKGKVRTALRVAEFDLARAEAETLNEGAGADAEAQTLLGDALWGNGLFDEADTAYRRALATEPGSSRARFGLARSLATRSRLDEALTESLQTATLAPQDPEVHALVGLVYERLNRYDEAADAYERYIALLPMTEISSMATISQSKVRLLRSFKGRVPLEVTETAGRVYRVPFRMVNRKIVLQGRQPTPVEFVFDTGSSAPACRTTARRAGVTSVTATLTAGVGVARCAGSSRAPTASVGALRIATCRYDQLSARRLTVAERELLATFLGYSLVVDYQRRKC